MATTKATSIGEYIDGFTGEAREVLKRLRAIIHKTAPNAVEKISYAIPAFFVNGKYLVYFAGYAKHVSIYPIPKGNAAFQKKIDPYRSGKSTAQFKIDEPLPEALIIEIVRFLMKDNATR